MDIERILSQSSMYNVFITFSIKKWLEIQKSWQYFQNDQKVNSTQFGRPKRRQQR